MLIYLRALGESFRFAVNALTNNKLRTFLSLMGVTVGIFSIIGVLAAVDSLEQEIKGSLSSIDSNLTIVFHQPFGPTEIPRWRWQQFDAVKYEEYQYLKRTMDDYKAISYELFVPNQVMKYEEETIDNVNVRPVTEGTFDIESLKFDAGRFFNESEAVSGSNVVVLGHDLSESLFGTAENAMGKRIRLLSRKFTIIGVLQKEGDGIFGSNDESAFIPFEIATRIYGKNKKNTFPQIKITPVAGVDMDEFSERIEQRIRKLRGLKPEQLSGFFVAKISGFTDVIDGIIGVLTLVGWGIGGFALLVGGFGIANIMFVSVRERTNLIGIQKALGAKRRFILFQFLFESVLLSIFGGIIGLLLVQLVVLALDASKIAGDFEFILSFGNIFLGLFTTFIIGIIAGIIPAISASRLDPVEAIRTGM